jgi:hypothetical protein
MTSSTVIICQNILPILPRISARTRTEAWINQEAVDQFLHGLGIDGTFPLNESAVSVVRANTVTLQSLKFKYRDKLFV